MVVLSKTKCILDFDPSSVDHASAPHTVREDVLTVSMNFHSSLDLAERCASNIFQPIPKACCIHVHNSGPHEKVHLRSLINAQS